MFTIKDIHTASTFISDYIHCTPIHASENLSRMVGKNLYFKTENLQKTGSFKIRGASNFLLQHQEKNPRLSGVVAASSGNHGQAVAYMASRLGIPAVIVMPQGASRAKVQAAEGYGARVEFCGTTSPERLSRAAELAQEGDYLLVPPYDHPYIMAGQGTLGVEILEQLPDVDIVLVPIGGGGLISGTACAIKELRPQVTVLGVEPAGSNSMQTSLQAGRRVQLKRTHSAADGLLTLQPGELTFPVVQKYVDDILLVTEEEIRLALRLCLERLKLVVEPSGAATLAAVLQGGLPQGKNIVAVISGGNVDVEKLSQYLGKQA